MQYFDVQSKTWKPFPTMVQLTEATACFCAELVGNYLYVAAQKADDCVVYRHHVDSNTWVTLPPLFGSANQINCLCFVEDHVYAIYHSLAPHRYSVPKNQWQCVANSGAVCNLSSTTFCNKAAVVFRSCIYVIHGQRVHRCVRSGVYVYTPSPATMYCFDPNKNVWQQKASTNGYHFASSLFVVNDRLYVAGGKCSIDQYHGSPVTQGSAGSVEVYDEQKNSWSSVQQPHIPPNNLGAIEVEGRVYFIINNFPIDSGIRIPPGEVYPVCLDEWENLGKIQTNAILSYVPIKMENLTVECT